MDQSKEKGIIYLMSSSVSGLVKIGKTGSDNFTKRMYFLESNGYRNVTGLKREFAIEVDGYSDKELLLHTIFQKSRVADTELFAVDINIVIQLLSSFEGKIIYPETESKEEIFEEAADKSKSKLIPDGYYNFSRKKKADGGKLVTAKAKIINGVWTLLKGSILGITETVGVPQNAKEVRSRMPISANGELLDDFSLGECSPSFAANIVVYQASDGWKEWKCANGQPIDVYRPKVDAE